jgi:hypothetical protein
MFRVMGPWGLTAVLGGAVAPASPGDWWLGLFGEPGAATSAMDLLLFLARTLFPAGGIWQVLDVDALVARASTLYPPAWGDILRIVVGGLVTTFSIMILLAIITWGLGKVMPRLAPAGPGDDRKGATGGGRRAFPQGEDV